MLQKERYGAKCLEKIAENVDWTKRAKCDIRGLTPVITTGLCYRCRETSFLQNTSGRLLLEVVTARIFWKIAVLKIISIYLKDKAHVLHASLYMGQAFWTY